MKKFFLIATIFILAAGVFIYARSKDSKKPFPTNTSITKQGKSVPEKKPKKAYKNDSISSTLLQIEELKNSSEMTEEEFEKEVTTIRGFTVDTQGRVFVEIVGPIGGEPVSPELINKFGGQVGDSWKHRTEAWIPINQLSNFAKALPKEYFVEEVQPPWLDTQ